VRVNIGCVFNQADYSVVRIAAREVLSEGNAVCSVKLARRHVDQISTEIQIGILQIWILISISSVKNEIA
jgi:hypothetical protein